MPQDSEATLATPPPPSSPLPGNRVGPRRSGFGTPGQPGATLRTAPQASPALAVPAAFAPPTPAQQRHRQRILQIRQEVGKFYSEIATKVATVESLFAQIEGSEGGAEEITRDGLPAEEIKALLATLKSALTVSP